MNDLVHPAYPLTGPLERKGPRHTRLRWLAAAAALAGCSPGEVRNISANTDDHGYQLGLSRITPPGYIPM
jgi:hypothetical protein